MGILVKGNVEWLQDEKFLSGLLLVASHYYLHRMLFYSKEDLYYTLELYNYVYTKEYNWIKVNPTQMELPL